MYNSKQIKKIFQKIQVIRPPKRRLSTFGITKIQYALVTDIVGLPDRSRLRTGHVTADKPAIITPQSLKQLFQGFSAEANEYADSLTAHYGQALRGLEYQFSNEPTGSQIELGPPEKYVQKLAEKYDREGEYNLAIIQGTDKLWELSIMKFIVEETISSFSANLQELHERGFFEEDREVSRRHREIENLIRRAKVDRNNIPILGKKLKEFGLFEHYQDVFFGLINR